MVLIYVGNLDRRSTEANVRSAFEAYGQVTNINLGSGFAVVVMADDQQAQSAISDFNDQKSWVVRRMTA